MGLPSRDLTSDTGRVAKGKEPTHIGIFPPLAGRRHTKQKPRSSKEPLSLATTCHSSLQASHASRNYSKTSSRRPQPRTRTTHPTNTQILTTPTKRTGRACTDTLKIHGMVVETLPHDGELKNFGGGQNPHTSCIDEKRIPAPHQLRVGNLHTPQTGTHKQSPPIATQTTTFQRSGHADNPLRRGHLDTRQLNTTQRRMTRIIHQRTKTPPDPQQYNPHNCRAPNTETNTDTPRQYLHAQDNTTQLLSDIQYDVNTTHHHHHYNRANQPPTNAQRKNPQYHTREQDGRSRRRLSKSSKTKTSKTTTKRHTSSLSNDRQLNFDDTKATTPSTLVLQKKQPGFLITHLD